MRSRLPLLVVSGFMIACGSSKSSQFPSSDDLRLLAAKPIPASPRKDTVVDVDSWELAGPLPTMIGDTPTTVDGPAAPILSEVVRSRPGMVLVSEQSQCLVREMGRFHAEHKARMAQSLRDFIATRCGLTGTLAITSGFRYQTGGKGDENTAGTTWAPELVTAMKGALSGGDSAHLVGLWIGDVEGTRVAAWIVAPRKARLDPVAMVPNPSGQVILKGEVLMSADRVEALINRGPHGVGTCFADPRVKLPRFALTCESERTDDTTLIQVGAFPPGRILGPSVLVLRISPDGSAPKRYLRPHLPGAADPGGAGVDPAQELATMVAVARARANLPPLPLNRPQSHVGDQLAPHFFAALARLESEQVADQVILGMRAGWSIGAPLRSGDCIHGIAEGVVSLPRLVAQIVAMPRGRHALLDPSANHLAIGVTGNRDQGYLGSLFATYQAFTPGPAHAAVATLRNRINTLRSQIGLPPAGQLTQAEADLAIIAAGVSQGSISPEDGLSAALNKNTQQTNRPARGFFLTAYALDSAAIPDAILAANPLSLAVGVGDYQAKGEPWHQHIVYLIAADSGTPGPSNVPPHTEDGMGED